MHTFIDWEKKSHGSFYDLHWNEQFLLDFWRWSTWHQGGPASWRRSTRHQGGQPLHIKVIYWHQGGHCLLKVDLTFTIQGGQPFPKAIYLTPGRKSALPVIQDTIWLMPPGRSAFLKVISLTPGRSASCKVIYWHQGGQPFFSKWSTDTSGGRQSWRW